MLFSDEERLQRQQKKFSIIYPSAGKNRYANLNMQTEVKHMSRNDSGGKLERFFTGKGFYIVLFLCAAVIGVSAWMLASGSRAMVKEADVRSEEKRVETVIIPPPRDESRPVIKTEAETSDSAPEMDISETEKPAEEITEVWSEAEEPETACVWPVSGQLERTHDMENLSYDVTMKDWRTHDGIDILSPLGTEVTAARAGTVTDVSNDDFYGTTVTIDHGDGTVSIYSNLEEQTAVSTGDHVEAGMAIGSVGSTALCESGQCSHLHFAVKVNGESRDPLEFLPA